MSATTSMPKSAVEIVQTYAARVSSVAQRAGELFAERLAEYVVGVQRLAAASGSLPEDQADGLLGVAAELGITAERLGYDVEALIHDRNLAAKIEAHETRNAELRGPLPALEQELAVAEAACLKIRQEYAARLKQAEELVRTARVARDKVAQTPLEPTGHWHKQRRRLRELAPHVLGESVSEKDFRALLARRMESLIAGVR